MKLPARSLALATPIPGRPERLTDRLLRGCAYSALLALPALVLLGISLPAQAQILQLNPHNTGYNLSVYTPNYVSFILPASSTIENPGAAGAGTHGSALYGNAAYNW